MWLHGHKLSYLSQHLPEKQHLRYHQLVCGFHLGPHCSISILRILVKFTVFGCGSMSSRVAEVSLIGKDSITDTLVP